MLGLGVSVVSDAERYPGGNGITSGSTSIRAAGAVHCTEHSEVQ
jgi:hypothetical protein